MTDGNRMQPNDIDDIVCDECKEGKTKKHDAIVCIHLPSASDNYSIQSFFFGGPTTDESLLSSIS